MSERVFMWVRVGGGLENIFSTKVGPDRKSLETIVIGEAVF